MPEITGISKVVIETTTAGRRRFSIWRFTMLELMIVISMISILATMLLPAVMKSLQKAKEINCLSNLRQIGAAVFHYSTDYNNYALPQRVPAAAGSGDHVNFLTYLHNVEGSFTGASECPGYATERSFFRPYYYSDISAKRLRHGSYLMNVVRNWDTSPPAPDGTNKNDNWRGWVGAVASSPVRFSRIGNPAGRIYILDAMERTPEYADPPEDPWGDGWSTAMNAGITSWKSTDHGVIPTTNTGADYRKVGNHHRGGFNALFGDLHVEFMRKSQSSNWFTNRL